MILYLSGCDCEKKRDGENAACMVKNQLEKVGVQDAAVKFLIGNNSQQTDFSIAKIDAGLVGHFHLDEQKVKDSNTSSG